MLLQKPHRVGGVLLEAPVLAQQSPARILRKLLGMLWVAALALRKQVREEYGVNVVKGVLGLAPELFQCLQVGLWDGGLPGGEVGDFQLLLSSVVLSFLPFVMSRKGHSRELLQDTAHVCEGFVYGCAVLVEAVLLLEDLQGSIEALKARYRCRHALDALHVDHAVLSQLRFLQQVAKLWLLRWYDVHSAPLRAGSSGRQLVDQDLVHLRHGQKSAFQSIQKCQGLWRGRKRGQHVVGLLLAAIPASQFPCLSCITVLHQLAMLCWCQGAAHLAHSRQPVDAPLGQVAFVLLHHLLLREAIFAMVRRPNFCLKAVTGGPQLTYTRFQINEKGAALKTTWWMLILNQGPSLDYTPRLKLLCLHILSVSWSAAFTWTWPSFTSALLFTLFLPQAPLFLLRLLRCVHLFGIGGAAFAWTRPPLTSSPLSLTLLLTQALGSLLLFLLLLLLGLPARHVGAPTLATTAPHSSPAALAGRHVG